MTQVSAEIQLAAEVVNELPVPAWMFGVGFLVAFAALAFVTFSYRNVANKHKAKPGATSGGHH